MKLQLLRGRHVDHRRQHHEHVCTERLRVLGECHRRGGRQLRNAHDDRHAAAGRADGGPQHGALFLSGEGIVLPARPQHHEAMHAVVDHCGLHRAGRGEVDPEVGVELSGHRRQDAGPGAA